MALPHGLRAAIILAMRTRRQLVDVVGSLACASLLTACGGAVHAPPPVGAPTAAPAVAATPLPDSCQLTSPPPDGCRGRELVAKEQLTRLVTFCQARAELGCSDFVQSRASEDEAPAPLEATLHRVETDLEALGSVTGVGDSERESCRTRLAEQRDWLRARLAGQVRVCTPPACRGGEEIPCIMALFEGLEGQRAKATGSEAKRVCIDEKLHQLGQLRLAIERLARVDTTAEPAALGQATLLRSVLTGAAHRLAAAPCPGGQISLVGRAIFPPAAIMSAVQGRVPDLLDCLPAAQRSANVAIEVKGSFAADGRFVEPQVTGATVSLPSVVIACLVDALSAIEGPPPAGGRARDVHFPLTLAE